MSRVERGIPTAGDAELPTNWHKRETSDGKICKNKLLVLSAAVLDIEDRECKLLDIEDRRRSATSHHVLH